MAAKRIIILGNFSKPGVADQIEALRTWFGERAEVLSVGPSDRPISQADQADLCIVFGGDGTLLWAARALAGADVPLMGVNMGKLGFLAEYNVEHMQRHFEAILAGEIPAAERMMLDVRVSNCREHHFESLAANDVAVLAGAPFRLIDLGVARQDEGIARYLGDGLVISTPTGSTGYNMSAGGPIMEPTLEALAITPVAPHSLSIRPIVVGTDKPIRITAKRVNVGSAVIIDGQISGELCDGDVVEVRRAGYRMRVFPHPGRSFFRTLTTKLQWGQSPHHPREDEADVE